MYFDAGDDGSSSTNHYGDVNIGTGSGEVVLGHVNSTVLIHGDMNVSWNVEDTAVWTQFHSLKSETQRVIRGGGGA